MANLDYYGDFMTYRDAFPIEQHVMHCQYLLLQNIMCHADLEIVTFIKVKGMPGPFPDFGVQQQCRNFAGVLERKERKQLNVSDEEWMEILVAPERIGELQRKGRTVPPTGVDGEEGEEVGIHY